MAINICSDCSGEMEKIEPVHTYDFNKDGWVPRYCIKCGLCSDGDKIIIATNVVVSILGHRFIERVMERICNDKLHQDYVFKKEILKLLKNEVFSEVNSLVEEIASHCYGRGYSVSKDYISNIIYYELDYNAFTRLPVTSP